MSKLFKILTSPLRLIDDKLGAAVSKIALTALSLANPIAGLVIAAVSVASSLLAAKPKAPDNSAELLNRLRANIDVRTPRKTAVGRTALNTDIRDEEYTDNQTYFHRFIVVASHKVNAISEVWFDDKLAWTLAGGVQGDFVGYLSITPILEGSAGNAINVSARMGSTRRFTGLAYLHIKYRLTGLSSKVQSPFATSITTRITVRGDGASLYDPRLDSTNGGAGSHRPDDQSTWAWSADACRNPALQMLFYLLGWRINGELAVGKGIPANRIDLASFAVAANICDELVTKIGGGTEPRYRSDGVWSEGDSPTTVLDMLKASMNADLDDVDGKLRLTVFHNDLAIPDYTFTENDVLDGFDWAPAQALNDTFNVVRGIYTDASDTALYQPVDYPQIEQPSEDGIDRIETFDLPLVQSAGQAQRLAAMRLARNNYGGTFVAEFQATAWAVEKNSVVTLTFAPLGFVNKLFRVAEIEIREDGIVPLTLREEHADIYGPPSLVTPATPIAASNYDPFLSPVTSAITDFSTALTGVSAGGAYATFDGTTNSTTAIAIGPELSVVAPASGNVDLSATYQFDTPLTMGTHNEYAQFYDVTGAATALGTENISSQPHDPANSIIGTGDVVFNATGLTPGNTYKYRLYMRNASGTTVRTISGTIQATPL